MLVIQGSSREYLSFSNTVSLVGEVFGVFGLSAFGDVLGITCFFTVGKMLKEIRPNALGDVSGEVCPFAAGEL